jgi:hypothetical protein
MSEISTLIIKIASKYLGLYETKENAEWNATADAVASPAQLESIMQAVGWKEGWPYCMAFCEAVWAEAYKAAGAPDSVKAYVKEKLTPSVMQSFNAVESRVVKDPTPGSIFFMQKGFTGNGHAGIVVGYNPETKKIATIEANTSPNAATAEQDRNGDGIYKKIRTLDLKEHSYNLHLVGFLEPIRWRVDGTII